MLLEVSEEQELDSFEQEMCGRGKAKPTAATHGRGHSYFDKNALKYTIYYQNALKYTI